MKNNNNSKAQLIKALEESLYFENLMVDISTHFINLPADMIDAAIIKGLEQIGKHLSIDRIALLEFSLDGSEFHLTDGYAALQLQRPAKFLVSSNLPWFTGSLRKGQTLRISSINEIPKEAKPERQYCKAQGIKAFCTIPMKIAGAVHGAISFSDMQSERNWTDHMVRQLQAVSDIVTNALARKRAMKALKERLRFEELISNISTRFVNISALDVEKHIEEGLRQVVEFLEVDRSTFFQFSADHKELIAAHSYAVSGLEPIRRVNIQKEFPWSTAMWSRGEVFSYSSISEVPEEAVPDRENLIKLSIKSTITIPLSVGGSYDYVFAVGTALTERTWPSDLLPRLKLIGELFVNALERKKAEEKITALVQQVEAENVYLREEVIGENNFHEVIGQSGALKYILYKIEQIAASDTTVLLLGETGTGKGLISRAIYGRSLRKDKAFVTVDCAALPANLIESELFGREKGAFTGAQERQMGRFELADRGTLFLDEIGELPLDLQAKLLRVIQDGEFERLGSPHTTKVDVRIIASTNRDLKQEIENGRFRKDLYYRLHVFPITIPPLRNRTDDIPLLAQSFIDNYARKMGKDINIIPKGLLTNLQAYNWPGNVRELQHVIERAVITTQGSSLRLADKLEPDGDNGLHHDRSVQFYDLDRNHIMKTLQKSNWKISGKHGAAEILGLNPSTLRGKMRKLGISKQADS